MSSVADNQYWRDFFKLFKSMECLWKVNSNLYRNKKAKATAWTVLLHKYKDVKSDATIKILKRKIKNIRGCYRRELKKVEIDNEYIPNLWYFYELEFLRDQDKEKEGQSAMCSEDELEFGSDVIVKENVNKRRRSYDILQEENEILEMVVSKLKNIRKRDEADIFSACWAASFRLLNNEQQIYAKKAIDEVLILGQLNQLTLNSVTSIIPPNVYSQYGISNHSYNNSSDPRYNATVVNVEEINPEVKMYSSVEESIQVDEVAMSELINQKLNI